jgi:UPF0755 protein
LTKGDENRKLSSVHRKDDFLKIQFSRDDAPKILAIAAGAVMGCAFLLLFCPWPVSSPDAESPIPIRKGLAPREIAALLKARGVIHTERGFLVSARMLGWSRRLQAGRYRFDGWVTHFSVLRSLARGRSILEKVTFPEGIRASRIAGILEKQLGTDSARVMRLVMDGNFCRRLNVESETLEGYLYPDTYLFQSSDPPETILERMVGHFQAMLPDSLREKARNRGWSVHQWVTLASLVEGEAALDSERPVIAAIYINRLKKGYPLQACPTIQYLLPDGPRRLLEKDLKIKSPYNTYLVPGLPPGPVNNPGIRSLRAVLDPAPVRYLYLVANGDGSHAFSVTLEEHNAAKRRFERIRKQVYSR